MAPTARYNSPVSRCRNPNRAATARLMAPSHARKRAEIPQAPPHLRDHRHPAGRLPRRQRPQITPLQITRNQPLAAATGSPPLAPTARYSSPVSRCRKPEPRRHSPPDRSLPRRRRPVDRHRKDHRQPLHLGPNTLGGEARRAEGADSPLIFRRKIVTRAPAQAPSPVIKPLKNRKARQDRRRVIHRHRRLRRHPRHQKTHRNPVVQMRRTDRPARHTARPHAMHDQRILIFFHPHATGLQPARHGVDAVAFLDPQLLDPPHHRACPRQRPPPPTGSDIRRSCVARALPAPLSP